MVAQNLGAGGGIDPSTKNNSLSFEYFNKVSKGFVPLIKRSILAKGIRDLTIFPGAILVVQK